MDCVFQKMRKGQKCIKIPSLRTAFRIVLAIEVLLIFIVQLIAYKVHGNWVTSQAKASSILSSSRVTAESLTSANKSLQQNTTRANDVVKVKGSGWV